MSNDGINKYLMIFEMSIDKISVKFIMLNRLFSIIIVVMLL